MIKLKSLFLESEPEDSDQWDNWVEYLDYFDYGIDGGEIRKFIHKFNLNHKQYFKDKILYLSDAKTKVYLEYDVKNDTYDFIKDIRQWVYDVDPFDLNIEESKLYNGAIGCTLDDLREHPGTVYHYTTPEKWELIQRSGVINPSLGTGLSNRQAYGVFTSVDPEEHADGSYGDICLEINLQSFKEQQGFDKLDLEFEPDVYDYLAREYISAVLDLQMDFDLSSDMSPQTVIVNHSIPIQYVREYGN